MDHDGRYYYNSATGLDASGNFPWFKIDGRSRVSFQIVWSNTGTPVGEFGFEVSNSPPTPRGEAPTDIVPSPLSTPTAWSTKQPGTSLRADEEFGFADVGAYWIRPKWTRTSGTSAVTIRGHAKP